MRRALLAATVTVIAIPASTARVSAEVQSPLTTNTTFDIDLAHQIVSGAEAQAKAGHVAESSGPWGSLKVSYVYIAAPDTVLQLLQVPSAVTRWTFVGMTKAEVEKVLDGPDVPAALRTDLADPSKWTVLGDRAEFCPSAAAIIALSPEARGRIYKVLAQWEVNEFQHSPCFVPEDDIDRWIGNSGLRPDVIEVLKRTGYRRGNSLCFSEVPLLVSMSQSHAESRALMKAFSRTRTAMISLKLDKSSDVARIREYWSSGNANAKDFLPLLESVAANPAIETLDIVHILPPYARKLCFSYPHPSQALGGRYPDCHWTTLNFFSYRPEERFFDPAGAVMFVQERCDHGEKPYQFGDMLFFLDSEGNAVHSCVYLADDFVFTKNGSNVITPWLIMKLPEVIDRYSIQTEPTIKIYRRRD